MANFIKDRTKPRVSVDPKTGSKTTQHWDGRKDVTVNVAPAVARGKAQ